MQPIPIDHCRYCLQHSSMLQWCKCGKIRYCSDACKKKDHNRHIVDCNNDNKPQLSPEHIRILNVILDSTSNIGDRVYPFLYARANRDNGDLFVVPVISRMRLRLNITDNRDAVLLTWSPQLPSTSTTQSRQPNTFMYVIDETNWLNAVVMSFAIEKNQNASFVTQYELEMERLGFLSGHISVLITSDGILQPVATKDVFTVNN